MHQLIESSRAAPSHRNLIRHWSHRMMMKRKRYRLYLDLYNGGRLYETLDNYFTRVPACYGGPVPPAHIPESFAWHVFGGLVDACLVLEQGRDDVPVKEWQPLVHNDMHLSNVMLERDPKDAIVSTLALKLHTYLSTDVILVASRRSDRLRAHVLRLVSRALQGRRPALGHRQPDRGPHIWHRRSLSSCKLHITFPHNILDADPHHRRPDSITEEPHV